MLNILLFDFIVGIIDDEFDLRSLLKRFDERLQQAWVAVDCFGLRLDQRMLYTFFSEGVVGCSYRYGLRYGTVGHRKPVCTMEVTVNQRPLKQYP